ncbi:dimethylaniline monooxygenase (N-oxide forming) [Arthrobacter sp. V1I7]|uniref:flavin-containing monooxygenase n=1 Tax=Arthrobacter sp. V1I7 TaxID=3042274 RepID=UPI0027896623|nr:NAD(P)-binding domain-containing protein [Arthrobacter sp. V1I7]MDQ0823778.1 dimethylaniline monooxygenase (N-oxide forming) [Arthrobacter sp. V1I7]
MATDWRPCVVPWQLQAPQFNLKAGNDMGSNPKRIAVIGAGAAGLCAAKHLIALNQDVTVFELGSHVGGLWVYENDSGRSPAYRSLHINSEAKVTGYRDFPLPKDSALFPSHEEIRAYLEAYAERFGVTSRIRFNSKVTAIEPMDAAEDPTWQVTLDDGSSDVFDQVVVANGHQAVPTDPPFAKDFTGTYLHSLNYRTPEPFTGKNVLVIGTGNSGLDIAADVCTVTKSTTISARSPVLIMPRMVLGVPLSRVLAKVERPWVPWLLRRRIRELVTRLVHGSMEQWGFSTPKIRTHPASHPTIISQIAWNRIDVRPGVTAVQGHEVRFADGSSASYDAIIAATGYEVDLPFLTDELSPVVGHRIDLYRRMVHPHWKGLYFVGLFDVSGGANIRMMDIQCRWLAALVQGRIELPGEDKMRASFQAEQRRMASLYPDKPRYGLELDPREYGLALRADLQNSAPALASPSEAADLGVPSQESRTPIG